MRMSSAERSSAINSSENAKACRISGVCCSRDTNTPEIHGMPTMGGPARQGPGERLFRQGASPANVSSPQADISRFVAGTTGLEPATSAVTGQRSNQLSYVPRGSLWCVRREIRVTSAGNFPSLAASGWWVKETGQRGSWRVWCPSYQARDQDGPAVSGSRRRALMPARCSISRPKSHSRSERRFR